MASQSELTRDELRYLLIGRWEEIEEDRLAELRARTHLDDFESIARLLAFGRSSGWQMADSNLEPDRWARLLARAS